MVRLYFYVEGQTEQGNVKRMLTPHLAAFDVQVMGAVLAASGRRHRVFSRGGGKHYRPMRNDLGRLLRQEAGADVRFTTMRQKTAFGAELAECVGIETTRRLCSHFEYWLKTLESLGSSSAGVVPT